MIDGWLFPKKQLDSIPGRENLKTATACACVSLQLAPTRRTLFSRYPTVADSDGQASTA